MTIVEVRFLSMVIKSLSSIIY